MAPLKIHEVGGMLPAWDDRYLPENQASFLRNGYLYSGAMEGWRTPKLLRQMVNPAAKFAYRVPNLLQGITAANLIFLYPPHAGDQITIGETIYTFASPGANGLMTSPNQVLLGGTALAG